MKNLQPYIVKNFSKGLITRLEDESLPKGAASDSNNWLSLGDHIELRRGMALMGTETTGVGRVTGLKVGVRFDGDEVLVYTHNRKWKYYDETTSDFVEVSTDIFPVDANNEDIAIDTYHSLAGAMFYASSPNSSIYKMPVANPGSALDLDSTTHRGKIRINKGTMYLWDRKDTAGGSDKTGLYRSHGDKVNLSDFTHTTKEDVGNGDGSDKTHSGTLAQVTGNKTCMYVIIAGEIGARTNITAITKATQAVITAAGHGLAVGDPVIITGVSGMTEINDLVGTVSAVSGNDVTVDINSSGFTTYSGTGTIAKAELFIDDRNGSMTSKDGGTGTINYATGAFTLTFNTAPQNSTNLIADYFTEDSNSDGITDFSYSATRVANEGFVLRQDDGGAEMQNMGTISGSEYCFHTKKTYKLDIDLTDLEITNKIYRNRVGIEYWRAMKESGDGIYYIDSIDVDEPAIRLLELNALSTGVVEAIPRPISDNLILSDYRFDKGVIWEAGLYIYIACRHKDSSSNDTVLMYHKLWKLWDKCGFRVSAFDTYDGNLVIGDSASNNVFKLFDGISDEDANIVNHWISGNTNLDIEGVKEANIMVMAGLIQASQLLEVYLSYDNGDFVKVGEIDGEGAYVDKGSKFNIGSNGIGTTPIGGGTGIEVSPYRREFRINSERFEKVRIKFVASDIGFVSVSEYQLKDLRYKGRNLPIKYLVN